MLGGLFARRRLRLAIFTLAGSALALVLIVAGLNAYVMLSADGQSTSDVADVPDAQVALVLGAYVEPDGRMSQMLADRVQRAVQLWRTGKVKRILVSGDHHTWAYDEPDTMRKALQKAGVPGEDIFTDDAGFDTWASMVRARKVFDVKSAIVITQGFHMPRALYLAHQAGLQAHGLTSDLHSYGTQGKLSDLREVLARVKAVGQAVRNSAVVLGPQIPITGDGRASWGPLHPPPHAPAAADRRLAG
ncbi:MAG TPA: ElyC/SanA/YdcF family protein [Solirubrobacteraceae bacterium]|jgi:SanA protein